MKSILTLTVLIALGFCMGCSSESDADKIVDAQECLDQYARQGGGNLSLCEQKVSGLTSPAAYGIRCSVGYIRDNKGTADFFINAFTSIETVNASNVETFLDLLAFKSAGSGNSTTVDANYNNVSSTYSNCALSQGKGATLIATFSFVINMLYKHSCDNLASAPAGSCAMSSASIATALAATVSNTWTSASLKTSIGTLVINTHEISCTSGSANDTLCSFLSRAIDGGGGTAAGIGNAFLLVLATP